MFGIVYFRGQKANKFVDFILYSKLNVAYVTFAAILSIICRVLFSNYSIYFRNISNLMDAIIYRLAWMLLFTFEALI